MEELQGETRVIDALIPEDKEGCCGPDTSKTRANYLNWPL